MKEELKQALLSTKRRAAEAAKAVREHAGVPPLELVRASIRDYILNKYMLQDQNISEDGITELTKISIAHVLSLDKELLVVLDRQSSGCGASSSTVTKKILLYLAIQKDFGITLPPDKMAYAESLHDIADIVYGQLRNRRYPCLT